MLYKDKGFAGLKGKKHITSYNISFYISWKENQY